MFVDVHIVLMLLMVPVVHVCRRSHATNDTRFVATSHDQCSTKHSIDYPSQREQYVEKHESSKMNRSWQCKDKENVSWYDNESCNTKTSRINYSDNVKLQGPGRDQCKAKLPSPVRRDKCKAKLPSPVRRDQYKAKFLGPDTVNDQFDLNWYKNDITESNCHKYESRDQRTGHREHQSLRCVVETGDARINDARYNPVMAYGDSQPSLPVILPQLSLGLDTEDYSEPFIETRMSKRKDTTDHGIIGPLCYCT